MSRRSNTGRAGALRWALCALVLSAALLAVAPRDLYGEKSWKECVDDAFVDYNRCLMSSGGWFERKLCDLAFEFEVTRCTAVAIGDIRKGYNEGSGAQP
jgi:hypothetical protein